MTDRFFCIREEKTESEQISLPGIGSRQPSEKKMLTRLSARRQKTPLTKFRLENGLPCLAFLGWRPRRHLPPIKFQTMTPTNLNMRHERSRKALESLGVDIWESRKVIEESRGICFCWQHAALGRWKKGDEARIRQQEARMPGMDPPANEPSPMTAPF